MDTIGVGVVGCGFVGRGAHIPAFSAIEGARLIAVADPDAGRRSKTVRKFAVPSACEDHRALVDDPAVDLVVVAVPTPLHYQVSLDAIRAGKHVLCEMPLASSLDEGRALLEAAQRQKVHLLPSLTFRFTPTFVKTKELIREGAIGRPAALAYREWIPARDLARQWPPDSWMWRLSESGGPLFTLSVWSIDLVRWLLESEVAESRAAVRYTDLEHLGGTVGYDASATLRMDDGTVASLQYSGTVASSAASNWLEIVGDNTGVLQATGNESVALLREDPARTEWHVKQPGAALWGHLQQDESFIATLLAGRAPPVSAADGLKAMEIALEIAKGDGC